MRTSATSPPRSRTASAQAWQTAACRPARQAGEALEDLDVAAVAGRQVGGTGSASPGRPGRPSPPGSPAAWPGGRRRTAASRSAATPPARPPRRPRTGPGRRPTNQRAHRGGRSGVLGVGSLHAEHATVDRRWLAGDLPRASWSREKAALDPSSCRGPSGLRCPRTASGRRRSPGATQAGRVGRAPRTATRPASGRSRHPHLGAGRAARRSVVPLASPGPLARYDAPSAPTDAVQDLPGQAAAPPGPRRSRPPRCTRPP